MEKLCQFLPGSFFPLTPVYPLVLFRRLIFLYFAAIIFNSDFRQMGSSTSSAAVLKIFGQL
jgi:hypothetical protein